MDGWLVPDPAYASSPDFAFASASNGGPIAFARPAPVSRMNLFPRAPSAESNRQLFQSALAATVLALQTAGKQVILVQDAPSFPVEPLLRVRTAHIPARRALALALIP